MSNILQFIVTAQKRGVTKKANIFRWSQRIIFLSSKKNPGMYHSQISWNLGNTPIPGEFLREMDQTSLLSVFPSVENNFYCLELLYHWLWILCIKNINLVHGAFQEIALWSGMPTNVWISETNPKETHTKIQFLKVSQFSSRICIVLYIPDSSNVYDL